jgi:hypothetical protein
MALGVSPISFGNNRFVISNPDSDSTVKETYDGKVRTKRVVMDSHQRIVDSVNFDNLGRKVSHLHKFYTDNGYIETYKDFKHKNFERHFEKRWMWRMPDIMSVSLQDFLYSW